LAGASTALAAQGLPYNFVEAGYVNIDIDDTDVDADGFGLRAQGLINPNVYLFGEYTQVETDRFEGASLELDQVSAGLGYRAPLNQTTDFNATVSYERAKAKFKGSAAFLGSDSENGFGLGIGLRTLLTPVLEGRVGVDYVDIGDEDDTVFGAGLRFNITPAFALGADYAIGSDAKGYTLGARLSF
jgi:opacity protein-like surface antigen